MTTCPRDGASYLADTLASLGDCRPLVLDDRERRGARWNMWRALSVAGGDGRVLILQDDVIALPGLLETAATIVIPDDVGIVTFHDFGDDFEWKVPLAGIHKFPAHRFGSRGLCGAQALLLPGDHARWLATQDRDACPKPGPHGADYAVGWWTAQSSRPNKLIVVPALVKHIGEESACWQEERQEAGTGAPHAGRTFADFERELAQ